MSFPRYPKYKASGVEWLGEVPVGWEVARLKNVIAQKITDGPHTTPTFCSDGVPFLSVDGIQDGELQFDGCRFISHEDHVEFRRKALPRKGDLLMGKAASTGKLARVKVDFEFSIWSPLALIRLTTSNANPAFFEQWLKSPIAQAQIDNLCTSNTQKNISMDDIPRLIVTIPPLPEQTAIAEFLDRETAKIDGLVAEQRRLMELLKEKITSLVLSSVDLPNTKRLRFGKAASLMSRPVLQQQEESYTRIGLFNRGRGLFHKDASEMDDMGESDFFWIEKGDLIISGQFAWEGAVAMAGKDETGCVVSHRYPVIRGIPGIALTEYLFGLLCTNHGDFLLNEHSRGAAGRNRPLNIRSLMKETIPVPSMQIQETIARAIHSRTVLFQEISNAVDLLQEHRTSLISAAVTGQIDVRQQTRN